MNNKPTGITSGAASMVGLDAWLPKLRVELVIKKKEDGTEYVDVVQTYDDYWGVNRSYTANTVLLDPLTYAALVKSLK